MIIQSDAIRMNAHRSYEEYTSQSTSYACWNASTGASSASTIQYESYYRENDHGSSHSGDHSSKDYEKESKELLDRFKNKQSIHGVQMKEQLKSLDELRQQSIDYLLYMLFGRKGDAPDTSLYKKADSSNLPSEVDGGSYSSSFYYSERETTCFDTTGTVVTSDGKQLKINISLEMSRSFVTAASENVNFGVPPLCDPLVINLSGTAASNLTDQKFFFDLDADGHTEQISSFSAGTGLLALDKNEDGTINDGNELFGTTSGNGSEDLAAYDSDQNGWIDEADDIFSKLLIWTKDSNGNDVLTGLGKAGVGAIYLGSKDTSYSIKSKQTNQTDAIIRKTGLFLYENGGTGTMQQLDLAQ